MIFFLYKIGVVVLGIYVVDFVFCVLGMFGLGQIIVGIGFVMGFGGKGFNQVVVVVCVGVLVCFILVIGKDFFGDFVFLLWCQEIIVLYVCVIEDVFIGVVFIYVNDVSGDNVIIVVLGVVL